MSRSFSSNKIILCLLWPTVRSVRRPTVSYCHFMMPRGSKTFLCGQTQQVFEQQVLLLPKPTETQWVWISFTYTPQTQLESYICFSRQRQWVTGSGQTVHQVSSGKWELRSCPPPSPQQELQRRHKHRVTQGRGDTFYYTITHHYSIGLQK